MKVYETHLEEYSKKYEDFVKFKRKDSILEIRLHTNDGAFKWSLDAQRAMIHLLEDINEDPENEILIVTGTGDEFLGSFDRENWEKHGAYEPFNMHQGYDRWYHDQTRMPLAWLNLQIPTIAAMNGPSVVHAEIPLLQDIVIATPNSNFYEGHWDGLGIVPGDGTHTLWRELLGPNRFRYFLYMGNTITAEQALDWGVIGEIVPQEKLLERAWEIAYKVFLPKSRIQRRMSRAVTTQHLRNVWTQELYSGLAHECFACFDSWPMGEQGENKKDMDELVNIKQD